MFRELEQAWLELDADPEVRVIVNTGNGRAFQTGLDMVQVAKDKDALRQVSRQTRDFELRFTSWQVGVRKPVIAAVNGVCAGGGLHFVADADIVIMASDATFTDPHVSVGQVSVFETIALMPAVADGVDPAHGVHRPPRAHAGGARVSARDHQPGRRSARQTCAPKPRPRGREDRQELAHGHGRSRRSALWEALELNLHDACAAGAKRTSRRCGATPTRKRARSSFTEKRDADLDPPRRESGAVAMSYGVATRR